MLKDAKARYATIAALVVAAFVACCAGFNIFEESQTVTVGFIYDNDETTPYSYSFYQAQEALQNTYGDRVRTFLYSNVQEDELATPIKKLVDRGCDIIFTNSYGNMRELAKDHPTIEFCQVSNDPFPDDETYANYHTFKGEAYQARYASGVVAGLKLQQMIDEHTITPEEALVGFVAAYPYAEVISGYTAFLLGVRSVVPEATMRVSYSGSWSSYMIEKACATELLSEGCVIISQHTDTISPAIACEECYGREVYHVGYNCDMTDVAPNTSLTSARINWEPYVIGAVQAVMEGRPIEEVVEGNVHAHNDMSAGIVDGWVEITPLNETLMPEGAQQKVDETLEALRTGEITVFAGDYRGVNPNDKNDVIDLRNGFVENEDSSMPSFCYILDDVVSIDEDDWEA